MSAVGRRIDRYVVEAELDSGGFGTVYRARHTVTGRRVALKLLHASREASLDVVERFLREARILSAISSPHVVQVLDAGISDEKKLFLAMELLEGESLASRIARAGPLPVREAVAIVRQILAGLGAAHAVGVVHRDLKPANVFLARGHDGRETAKVLDFGISKSRARGDESVITLTGAVLGTPAYMAPEQLHGARDVDGRADLYAATVCLYEMLSGQLPYRATTLEGLIAQRLSDPPAPLESVTPHLPRALFTIVDRGLARDPDARFRTPVELDAALATLEGAALPATAQPAPMSTRPAPASARPSPYASHRPDRSVAASAVMMPSPVAKSVPPAPSAVLAPAPRSSNAPLFVLLGGALTVILLLVAALVAVTGLWLSSRASAPIALPTPAPTPAPPPALSPPVPVPVPEPVPALPPSPSPASSPSPSPASSPSPALPPSPSPSRPTRARLDQIVGDVDRAAVDALLARAAPAIDACRHGRAEDVVVQIFVSRGGSLPIVQPRPMVPHGDEATARCVASAIRAAGPFDHRESDGIVHVSAHLEP